MLKVLKRKSVFSMITVLVICVLTTVSVFAETGSVVTVNGEDNVRGGDISFSDFDGITLKGTYETSTAVWSIADIVDATGLGLGWTLSLELTQLKEYEVDYVADGKTIPLGSVAVTTAPIVQFVDDTSSALDTITPVPINTSLDHGIPVKLLSAEVGGGMGSYKVSPMTVTLTIPANTYKCIYKTDATVALVSGP